MSSTCPKTFGKRPGRARPSERTATAAGRLAPLSAGVAHELLRSHGCAVRSEGWRVRARCPSPPPGLPVTRSYCSYSLTKACYRTSMAAIRCKGIPLLAAYCFHASTMHWHADDDSLWHTGMTTAHSQAGAREAGASDTQRGKLWHPERHSEGQAWGKCAACLPTSSPAATLGPCQCVTQAARCF